MWCVCVCVCCRMHRGRVRLLANACVMVRTCGPWLHGGVLDGSSLRSPAPTIPRSHDGHMARHQLSTHSLNCAVFLCLCGCVSNCAVSLCLVGYVSNCTVSVCLGGCVSNCAVSLCLICVLVCVCVCVLPHASRQGAAPSKCLCDGTDMRPLAAWRSVGRLLPP